MNWKLGFIFAVVLIVIFLLVSRGRRPRGPGQP